MQSDTISHSPHILQISPTGALKSPPSHSLEEATQEPDSSEIYESKHVHNVYNAISSHFSQTRHKPWPLVERFLKTRLPGSVGVDVGCGNGKYLHGINQDVFIVGSDRSEALIEIAAQNISTATATAEEGRIGMTTRTNDVLVADTLSLPHPTSFPRSANGKIEPSPPLPTTTTATSMTGRFNFAICIAVIHHFSTPQRRIEAVRSVLDLLIPQSGQQALFYVWALEQQGSRRGWTEGDEQDVMVPWVLKPKEKDQERVKAKKSKSKTRTKTKTGREEGNVNANSGDINGDEMQAEKETVGEAGQTFQRYYHLYRRGELERDIEIAGGKVIEAGYERDNWWAVAEPA